MAGGKADLTRARAREARQAIGWSIRNLADRLGYDERAVRRWESGERDVPPKVGEWLERLARFHEQNPAPVRDASATRPERVP